MRSIMGGCHLKPLSFYLFQRSLLLTAPSLFQSGSNLLCTYRAIAAYPNPRTRASSKELRKSYNYLTAERLIPVKNATLSKQLIRIHDDKLLSERKEYKKKLLQNIDEKIHYLAPDVKNFVFFPAARNQENTKRLFRGNRLLPPRTFMRIYLQVLKTITSGARRDELIKLMQEAGVSPLPGPEVWKRYTDPKTADINIGLVYSEYFRRYFVRICEKYAPIKLYHGKRIYTIQAYILGNFSDPSKIRTLEQWGEELGELRKEELVDSSRALDSVSIELDQASRDLKYFGKSEVEQAIASMTLEEQQQIVKGVAEREEELYEEMRSRLLFAAQVLVGVNSLPDIKALQSPARVYFFDKQMRNVIRQNGSWFPSVTKAFQEYKQLPSEKQDQYYCFNSHTSQRTLTGLQLFILYCTRDYGISRSEAARRFFYLSELQQASLNFPFYYPIAPKTPYFAAFRSFYVDMCNRYGLSNKINNNCLGSRLFESAMRTKWKLLDPLERQKYFQPDRTEPIFPMQPSSSDTLNANFCEDDSNEPEVPSRDNKMAHKEESIDVVDAEECSESFDDYAPLLPTEQSQAESYQSKPAAWFKDSSRTKSMGSSLPVHMDHDEVLALQDTETAKAKKTVTNAYGIHKKKVKDSELII